MTSYDPNYVFSWNNMSGADKAQLELWKRKKHEARDAAASGSGPGDRFAEQYYAGTFDKELNKLAVDTETLWQGYYPSLYDPHTQEAADHLAAPSAVQIDPATGEPYPEPEPEPQSEAAGKKDPRGKIGYWRKKRLMKTGDWTAEMQKEYEWDNRDYNASIGAGTGAPRPTVNPDGTLVPWEYSNWVLTMGQWRGM